MEKKIAQKIARKKKTKNCETLKQMGKNDENRVKKWRKERKI